MKKIILTMATILSVAGYAYGQGEVYFNSTAAAITQISTNNGTIGKISGSLGDWKFALFIASSTNVTTVNGVANTISRFDVTPWTDLDWSFTGIYATNIALAGRIVGATDPIGFATVPNTVVGSFYNFVICGWNTALGGTTLNSFIAAYNSGTGGLFYGVSGICAGVLMGNNGNPPNANLIGALSYQTQGWLLSVPEPATFALVGFGAAAMLIFRRGKEDVRLSRKF